MSFDLLFSGIACLLLCVYGLLILFFTHGFYALKNRVNKSPTPGIPSPSLLHRVEPRRFATSPPRHLATSILLPVRNEQRHILRVLEELRLQDYPSELLEVIVSDDFSDDATMILAAQFAAGHSGFRLKLARGGAQDGHGKKRAITRAIGLATGEIMLTTDADAVHGTAWVSAMVAGFTGPQVSMVLGPVVFSAGGNLLQRLQSEEFAGIMGTTAGSAGIGHPVMCNGASLGYRRTVFSETGGYEGNLRYASGDDQFLMSAVRRKYGRGSVVFVPDSRAIVYTDAEKSFSGFIHQRVRWVSKGPGYRDPWVIGVGMVTWITVVTLLTGLVAGLFVQNLLPLFLFLWFAKVTLDYPLVLGMQRFAGVRPHPGIYLLAQAFQLIYVPVISLAGLFIPFRWKGRRG